MKQFIQPAEQQFFQEPRTSSDTNVAVENIYRFTFQESRADFFKIKSF